MLLYERKLSFTLLYCEGASLRVDELVALDACACRDTTPLFAGLCRDHRTMSWPSHHSWYAIVQTSPNTAAEQQRLPLESGLQKQCVVWQCVVTQSTYSLTRVGALQIFSLSVSTIAATKDFRKNPLLTLILLVAMRGKTRRIAAMGHAVALWNLLTG